MSRINYKTILLTLFTTLSFSETYSQNYWPHSENYWMALCTPSLGGGAPAEFGGGMSILYPSKMPKPLMGMSLKLRVDNDETKLFRKDFKTFYYIGISYFFKQGKQTTGNFRAISKDTLLFKNTDVTFQFNETVSYFMFDFGADYYFYTGKQENFSVYAGWVLGVNVPFYEGEYKLSEYDPMNFTLQTKSDWEKSKKESNMNYKAGLNIGANKPIGIYGTFFIEISPFVNLISDRNITDYFTINSRFFLSFSLGYRYEF
jgi:hypothetical protein